VVLIERGFEVGGADERFGVGTVARIVQAAELPDGRWVIAVVGTERLRVSEWLAADPYPIAAVDRLAEAAWDDADADVLARAESQVRRCLALSAELGQPGPAATVELASDRAAAAWQLVGMAPLGTFDKQRLLEIDVPRARLEVLAGLAEEQAAMLAYRLEAE
jgi:Lon protease-like protein